MYSYTIYQQIYEWNETLEEYADQENNNQLLDYKISDEEGLRILSILDTYKISKENLPTFDEYKNNNYNLSIYLNKGLTSNNYTNYIDYGVCLAYNIYGKMVNNYNNFYEYDALSDVLLNKINSTSYKIEINSRLSKFNNYYDIDLDYLKKMIIVDQKTTPTSYTTYTDTNSYGYSQTFPTFDKMWIDQNEIFLIANILNFNILKLKDLNIPKKNFEFEGNINIYTEIFRRLIKNQSNLDSYISYLLEEIPYNKYELLSWFKSEYAHYIPDSIDSYNDKPIEIHKLVFKELTVTNKGVTTFKEGIMDIVNRIKYDFEVFLNSINNNESVNVFLPQLANNETNSYNINNSKGITQLYNECLELHNNNNLDLIKEYNNFNSLLNFDNKYFYNDLYNIRTKFNNFSKTINVYEYIRDYIIRNSVILKYFNINDNEFYELRKKTQEQFTEYFNNKIDEIQINNQNKLISLIGENKEDGLKKNIQNLLKGGQNAYCSWIEEIGHYIIDYVEVYINDQLIDKVNGEWLHINSSIMNTKGHKRGYNYMIGNIPENYNFNNNIIQKQTLYIPIPFWFTKDANQSLPLIALQHSDISIKLSLKKLNECLNYEEFTFFHRKPKVNCNLLVEYIYVEKNERNLIATSKNEYLIETLQYKDNIYITKNDIYDDNMIDIEFNMYNSSKYLSWLFQPTYYINNNSRIKKNNKYMIEEEVIINQNNELINNDEFDLYSVKKLSELKNLSINSNKIKIIEHNIYDELKISFNNVFREQFKKNDYYNLVQGQLFNKSIDNGINLYSFSLFPTRHQPSGTANLSKINKIYFNIKLSEKAIELLNSNKVIKLSVYNMSYNVLRISSGLAGLVFTHIS